MAGVKTAYKDELQPVLKSLRKAGVNIVAIRQLMTHEDPQYLFFHYWGRRVPRLSDSRGRGGRAPLR